jgi:hypothetical protein
MSGDGMLIRGFVDSLCALDVPGVRSISLELTNLPESETTLATPQAGSSSLADFVATCGTHAGIRVVLELPPNVLAMTVTVSHDFGQILQKEHWLPLLSGVAVELGAALVRVSKDSVRLISARDVGRRDTLYEVVTAADLEKIWTSDILVSTDVELPEKMTDDLFTAVMPLLADSNTDWIEKVGNDRLRLRGAASRVWATSECLKELSRNN